MCSHRLVPLHTWVDLFKPNYLLLSNIYCILESKKNCFCKCSYFHTGLWTFSLDVLPYFQIHHPLSPSNLLSFCILPLLIKFDTSRAYIFFLNQCFDKCDFHQWHPSVTHHRLSKKLQLLFKVPFASFIT